MIKPGESSIIGEVSLDWAPGEKKLFSGKLQDRIIAVRLVNEQVHVVDAKPLRGWDVGGKSLPLLAR